MILDTIVAATKARVAKLKESVPLELIKAKAEVIARAELAKQGGQFPFAFEKVRCCAKILPSTAIRYMRPK